MSVILHISDLHFGRVDPVVEEAFETWLSKNKVDITVVSGDFTQRAKRSEFSEAADFVRKLPEPRILVPGNHDIPLYNLFRRFVSRLRRYKKYITRDMHPVLENDTVLIAGINTAHSLTIKDGRITHAQLRHLKHIFGPQSDKVKILVTHHPLHMLDDSDERVATRSQFAIEILRDCEVDVLLSGHYHRGMTGISTVHKESKYDAILVQSGTSLSNRYRGQNNSFNVLEVDTDNIAVDQYEWQNDDKTFVSSGRAEFVRRDNRWVTVEKTDIL